MGEETAEAIILEEALIDDEMKERVLKRVELVARVKRPLPCCLMRFFQRL
jgi:hypothetical protein